MSDHEQEEQKSARFSAPITGFVQYDPQKQYQFNLWLKKVAAVYERLGFTPLHLRPFEPLAALRGDGETQKQIFEVFRADTGKTTELALPFDHTVPLALWVAEQAGHLTQLSFPYKRYDLGLSYRGERPKAGRFRAFVQADVDIVGKQLNLSADAECLAAIVGALTAIGVGPFRVRFNHIAIVKSLLIQEQIPEDKQAAVLRCVDKLDKLSVAEVAAEMAQIEGVELTPQKIERLLSYFVSEVDLFDPALETRYGAAAAGAIGQLRTLLSLLKSMDVDPHSFQFSPGMVRGLSYYTGIVFETLLVGKESYGSVAGGGRYSNLVGSFSERLQEVEGVGGSVGLTRLFDIACKTDYVLPKRTTFADVLVGARTEEFTELAYQFGSRLRQLNYNVDIYSGPPKIKHILSHANSLGVPYAVLVMDSSAFVVKDMQAQTQNEFSTLQEALNFVRSLPRS